jgi:Undecaprenyl-phosphate glucose phosphotransferase
MIRRRLNYIDFSHRLSLLFVPVPAFYIAAYTRFRTGWFRTEQVGISYPDYFGLLLLATVVWAIIVDHYRLAGVESLWDTDAGAAKRTFTACVVAYVVVTGVTFFYGSARFSRLFVFFSGLALFILTLATQAALRVAVKYFKGGGRSYSRLLIIGADSYAVRAADSLLKSLVMPSSVAGFVRLSGQQPVANTAPVFELDSIVDMAVKPDVDDIVIAVPPARLPETPAIASRLESLCVPIRAILDLGGGVAVRDAIFQVGDVTLLDLRASPSESISYSLLKRSFDLVFSLVAIILTAPLMLVIALLIKLTSPGPVLFVQERVGLNGRLFRMYKFRTMHVGDPEESETRWTTENDPRRTRIGTFLRRTNLDELPQFFNVLKGHMSVVGPRPERPFFVKKFLDEVAQYNTRHYLKVGVTGWAQVNGWRGDSSISKRVEYDLHYLRNWSLAFDLKIIWLTLWRGFFGKHAY